MLKKQLIYTYLYFITKIGSKKENSFDLFAYLSYPDYDKLAYNVRDKSWKSFYEKWTWTKYVECWIVDSGTLLTLFCQDYCMSSLHFGIINHFNKYFMNNTEYFRTFHYYILKFIL